ncbi:MAG: dihydropteroate synthase [Candidatus Omnitrophica bacterium]|nr:dihydropteroate synthase [Candidatus Omnitrophota bacterium]
MTERQSYCFQARGRLLALGSLTRIMGIINVTPDSFSGDGQLKGRDLAGRVLRLAGKMAADGADIIDIGGVSTRPGAVRVSAAEECRRVVPVIEALTAARCNAMISVDTSSSLVARSALQAGAHLINVVQGNHINRALLSAVHRYDAGIVLMHMRGTPRTMQNKVCYKNFIPDVIRELGQALQLTLDSGINRARVIVDPGIGFAKTAEQNFLLLKHLGCFNKFGLPILVGPSRKSFIGSILGSGPSDRLFGTVAAVVAGVMHGAHIVRVHDVLQVKQAVSVADAIIAVRETSSGKLSGLKGIK